MMGKKTVSPVIYIAPHIEDSENEHLNLKHENYHIYLTVFQPLIIINGWNPIRFFSGSAPDGCQRTFSILNYYLLNYIILNY